MGLLKRILLGFVSLMIATVIWLMGVHLVFTEATEEHYRETGVPPKGEAIAARHMRLWTDPALREIEIRKMRRSNAEWDFMGRSFVAWSLANMAVREPATKARCLEVIDRIIEETVRLEAENGHLFFLMPYAKRWPFRHKPARSLFVDGEIALMLGMRRVVEERADYRPRLAERVRIILERMGKSASLSAESYPDECWMFCNTVALAAVRVADYLDGTDHSAFFRRWVENAKVRLVHKETGILISSYNLSGTPIDGPEGSSIWMAAHMLQIIDEDFARDQYQRARKELADRLCGFGFAREWPDAWEGPMDIDSGPIVPGLGISAGSSGLALLGAAAFGDTDLLRELHRTLDFAAFPRTADGGLKYCASNQVGDAVILYSTVVGPIWNMIKQPKQP